MARRVYKYCRLLLKIKNKPARPDEEGKPSTSIARVVNIYTRITLHGIIASWASYCFEDFSHIILIYPSYTGRSYYINFASWCLILVLLSTSYSVVNSSFCDNSIYHARVTIMIQCVYL